MALYLRPSDFYWTAGDKPNDRSPRPRVEGLDRFRLPGENIPVPVDRLSILDVPLGTLVTQMDISTSPQDGAVRDTNLGVVTADGYSQDFDSGEPVAPVDAAPVDEPAPQSEQLPDEQQVESIQSEAPPDAPGDDAQIADPGGSDAPADNPGYTVYDEATDTTWWTDGTDWVQI